MKTFSRLTSFFIFLCSMIFSQQYGLKGLDQSFFEKYRVPEIKYRAFSLNGGINYSSYSYKYVNSDQTAPDKISENYTLQITPVYEYSNESEDMIFNIHSNLGLTGLSSFNENEGNSYFSRSKHSELQYGYNVSLSTGIIKYLQNSNYFASSKLYSRVVISKKDLSNSYRDYSSSDFNKNDDQLYDVEFGFGYGKIRNVTPLIQAARLQKRLLILNKLANSMNNETMLALAQQFAKSDAYNTVYDRPDKFFWKDLESVLENHGISLSGMNQYASSYLREVENELRFMRYQGFRVRSLVKYSYHKHRYVYLSTNNSKNIQENSLLSAGVRMEFSKQLNLRSQFMTSLDLLGGSFLSSDPDYKQEYSLKNTLSYAYELTDKFVIQCDNNFEYIIRNAFESGKEINNTVTISANYFWEDNIATALNYNWQHNKYDDLLEKYNYTHNDQYITFNFSYIFSSNFLMR